MSDAYTENTKVMYAHCGHIKFEWRCGICSERNEQLMQLVREVKDRRESFITMAYAYPGDRE